MILDSNTKYQLRMEEATPDAAPAGGALGGEATPMAAPDATLVETPVNDPSIYSDLTVNWPEGFDDSLKNEPMLKPFINKETGNVEVGNLLKSYSHTKKMVGSNKVTVPTENSTDLERTEFWEKLGFVKDEAEYKIEKAEGSTFDDAFMGDLKTFARENHMPLGMANKMMGFLEGQTKTAVERNTASSTEAINAGLETVKQEYGQAYDSNINIAMRVLNEVVADESVSAAMKDPSIGSNPAIIRTLVNIGKKLFKEDALNGGNGNGMLSPDDATQKVNEMMADKAGPYWNTNHPDHNRTVAEALKLREMVSPQR